MFLVIDVYLIVISLFCSPLRIRIVLVKVFVSNISADILSVQIRNQSIMHFCVVGNSNSFGCIACLIHLPRPP